MSGLLNRFKVNAQYFMPKKAISRVVGKLAGAKLGKTTQFLIKQFIKCYNIDMSQAEIQDITKFETFNQFFTRALKKGARPIDKDADVVLPADGMISEFGEIYKDAVLQAKGHYYSLEALLGGEEDDAKIFQSGDFVTVYLSPSDYHRVHMPLDGKLKKMIFVPGDLFSVNPLTAKNVDNLFARNERVVCFFENEKIGEFAVVLVGATIVASIETVFAGVVAPSLGKEKSIYDYSDKKVVLKKGEELGRFLLGSTVICVFPKGKVKFDKSIKPEAKVQLNKALANFSNK